MTLVVGPRQKSAHFTFVEYVCTCFDRLPINDEGGHAELIRDGYLSDAEVAAVARLHHVLKQYVPPNADHHDGAAVLADPSWHVVVEAAEEAQSRLDPMITDLEERKYLFASE